eukprot:10468990-Ditylum_brightwellii.AAC.2
MGRDIHPNLGLDYRILHLILVNIETEMLDSSSAALRGNEGLMMDTQGLIQHKNDGKFEEKEDLKHVIIPLLGEFKGEQGERWHLLMVHSDA